MKYAATVQETRAPLPGDNLLVAELVVDSAFTTSVAPAQLWPWIVQLGKNRAGWYLPYWLERWLPEKSRAYRFIDASLQGLAVGDEIDDWSGKDVKLKVVLLEPPRAIVYRARFRNIDFSWALVLSPMACARTRVHSRTRLAPVKHRRLARVLGGRLDSVVAAGLAAGLECRLAEASGA